MAWTESTKLLHLDKISFTYFILVISITIVNSAVPSLIPINASQQSLTEAANSEVIDNLSPALSVAKRVQRSSYLTPDPAKYDLNLEKVKDFMDYLVICYNYDYLSTQNPNEYTGMAFYNEKENKVDDLGILKIDSPFEVRETIRTNETPVHSQTNTFKAEGGDETVSTLAYGYDVTDSYAFKFGEKITVKAGFKVLTLAALEITAELNLEQTYTTTKTYKLSAPSQQTKVKANHKKEVIYTVYKGDSTLKGVLRVRIDPDQIIETWVLRNKRLNSHSIPFTFKGLVQALKQKGYGHLFNSNSLITQEFNKFYLNVPAEMNSSTNRLDVFFSRDIPLEI